MVFVLLCLAYSLRTVFFRFHRCFRSCQNVLPLFKAEQYSVDVYALNPFVPPEALGLLSPFDCRRSVFFS